MGEAEFFERRLQGPSQTLEPWSTNQRTAPGGRIRTNPLSQQPARRVSPRLEKALICREMGWWLNVKGRVLSFVVEFDGEHD